MGLADDAVAIQNLKARYCAEVDRLTGDAASAASAFRTIFLPDVSADYGHGLLQGAEAVTGFLSDALAGNSEWRIHMLHSPLIAVEGDRATGDWTVAVHLKRPGGGPVDLVLGRYSDLLARTSEGWRIARIGFAQQTA